MKTPAILIMTVTLFVIGILVLDFHLSNQNQSKIVPDDYSELITSVESLESKILLIGEDLPFPDSIKHQVVSSIDDLSHSNLGEIDYIIVHSSNYSTNQVFSIDQMNMLKLYNQHGAAIIFVGQSNYDFLGIDNDILSNYPYGIGMIKLNPNSFEQNLYEIHEPITSNLELRLYNVLRMMVPR